MHGFGARSRLLPILLTLVLAALGASWLAGAAPAQAHSAVVELVPADGAALQVPPPVVAVTFNDFVLTGTAQMRLTGPDGEVPLTVETAGPTVTGHVDAELGDGAYTVLWRVTSADGHPISDSYGFTVGDVPAPASAEATPAPGPDLASAAAAGSTGTKVLIAVAAALAGAAAIGGVWIRSRRGPRG